MLFHQRNKEVVAVRTQWAAKDERGAVSGAGSIIGPPATAYPFDVLLESDHANSAAAISSSSSRLSEVICPSPLFSAARGRVRQSRFGETQNR
jgi:hypothetical protein